MNTSLEAEIDAALNRCPRCRNLTGQERDDRVGEVLADVHRTRARDKARRAVIVEQPAQQTRHKGLLHG